MLNKGLTMSTRTQYFKLRGGILNERHKKFFIVLIASAELDVVGDMKEDHVAVFFLEVETCRSPRNGSGDFCRFHCN